ncbi:MAG: hypothetical protein HY289_06740 [Planctomycetes bacterium]|nr:hypothetical protein [Planctomycetota bacterium]
MAKSIAQLNRELGEQVLDEARRQPNAYTGKYVGIANGKVVVVTDDLNDLLKRLKHVEPDPSKTYCVELGRDYSKVYEIWEVV